MKRLSKLFTFVIIPEANQSVKRFTVSGYILVIVPSAIALLAICAAIFISLFSGNAAKLAHLQARLDLSQSGYEKSLQFKNDRIAALEADLTTLSAQADQIENKISEIAELESQLKEIVGIQSTDVHISSANSMPLSEGGQGGEEFSLMQSAEAFSLANRTGEEFDLLASLMDELKPSLEATKSAILKHQQLLDITPTIWPSDNRKITSTFGVRRDPISGRSAVHNGLDIGGNRGDPIYAAADGVVTLSERTYPQGNNILIDHGRGIETRYLHLNARHVEVGDKVHKGQLIGELGNTGRSTGPHLHYEVIVNGTHVDPKPYIQEDREERE
ncbi:M23 family metallopeptidase [Paenibacillus sp. PAMC21692]|uniref:M23 family metallopeptidase n=1 Tax=Paenibacillus sp. PAMC21692 TaxID=2762320 RepID=UPI00164D19B0|nr:M23 family metallopeptidase [Paenibacillus sp. PAMC21692]QNK59018.1 M23 family metallopeptidase [Paenibacillus sp. PAMC21692]